MHLTRAHQLALPHIRLFPRRRRWPILAAAATAIIAGTACAAVLATPAPRSDAAGGTVVLVAVTRPTAAQTVSAYRIRPGDTLSGIAARLCGSSSDYTGLAAANGIADPDLIYAGRTLYRIRCYRAAITAPHGYTRSYVHVRHHRYRVYYAPRHHYRHHYASRSYRGSSGCEATIIRHESGGNARAVNRRSGAGGLYQFLPSTWHGLGHSGLPQNASVSEQRQAYRQQVAQSGYSAWAASGGC